MIHNICDVPGDQRSFAKDVLFNTLSEKVNKQRYNKFTKLNLYTKNNPRHRVVTDAKILWIIKIDSRTEEAHLRYFTRNIPKSTQKWYKKNDNEIRSCSNYLHSTNQNDFSEEKIKLDACKSRM